MAHFTVEQVRELALAYFNGRDAYRKYPEDWFNGGESLWGGGTKEIEVDGMKCYMENCDFISLQEAISLFVNEDKECYYNETMNKDVPDFFEMMGETFNCDEVYYDNFKECGVFLNQDYLQVIVEAWGNTVGASIINSIVEEYYYYAKEK